MLKTYRRSEKRTSRLDVCSTCRMCLSQNVSSDKLVDIFVDEPITNVFLIKFCIGIECEENDGLPPQICYDCYSSLTAFFAFKRMCLSSDQYCKALRDAPSTISDPPFNEENVEPKEEMQDELSLAENSDMGLLETDCIDPGAPDDVLFQINKCEEDYQLAHPDEHVLPETHSLKPKAEEEANQVGPSQQVRDDVRMMIDRDFGDFTSADSSQPVHNDRDETSTAKPSGEVLVEEFEYTAQNATEEHTLSMEDILETNSSPVVMRMEEKKYLCDICSKPFLSQNSLKRHIKNHGSAQYKCPHCGKEFHQRSSMNRHLLLHSDRRFVCSSCSKVLLSREGLKCHIRTHHTDRKGPDYYKYKCTHCNKTFAHSSGLSRHMAIHRGICYECDICSKRFNDSSQLKRHRMKNHPSAATEMAKSTRPQSAESVPVA